MSLRNRPVSLTIGSGENTDMRAISPIEMPAVELKPRRTEVADVVITGLFLVGVALLLASLL